MTDEPVDPIAPHDQTAQLLAELAAIRRSSSWRMTAPLRAVTGWLRAMLRPQPVAAAAQPVDPAPPAPAAVAAPPRLWFYLGDTFDWLRSHGQLSGVGRVTTALFFAAHRAGDGTVPCALGPRQSLVPVSVDAAAAFLAHRLGGGRTVAEPPALPGRGPVAGDTVVFTGLVWTPGDRALFQALTGEGVQVCVLVYDIIPIEHPHFVTPAHAAMFTHWLGAVLGLASVVFVPSAAIAGQIGRWAALSGLPVSAALLPLRFGSAAPGVGGAIDPRVRVAGFVLSVGTIDARKNQAMLVRLWRRLAAEPGRTAMPQLVLVGHDDLHLTAAAVADGGDVLVLQDVDDTALAGLYRQCLFTVFPSLAEGYGLPVAESLAHGRLCLASDLAPIREHAGDLAWYWPPGDEAAAAALLARAIDDPPSRAAAEALIAARHRPGTWDETWRSMAAAASRPARATLPAPRPAVPDLPVPDARQAMATAAAWCSADAPEVSVLIVNWNAGPMTRECLRHVWAHTTGRRYEVIIVDNGSVADDLAGLRALGPGVRLVALGVNRYFGEANNIAAEMARGRHLCFLNNDAFVTRGWLSPLADALDQVDTVAAAGPLFLFPDGLIQEAGGAIGADGIPIRFGRGAAPDAVPPAVLAARDVDYISAAALLVRRDRFIAAGGFDLVYEPAYYEDVDLCFRLRAMGHSVRFCPASRVVHIEGSAADADTIAADRRNALGNRNRATFMARWGAGAPTGLRPQVPRPAAARTASAVLFTPYPLSTGGGERYLLSLAAVLAPDHAVTIATPHPYSTLRLANLGRELGLDLGGCTLATAADLAAAPAADLTVVLGNHILPPVPARSANTSYICQFPFPMPAAAIAAGLDGIGPYRRVIVYSDYARAHVLAGLSAHRMPAWPIAVLNPAVPRHLGDPARKRRIILSVGRFFAGGHSKRHDLMIAAFRTLLPRLGDTAELHLAGAAMPGPEHQDHLTALQAMASGLPVRFHVNAAPATLAALYADAAVYWHAAGMGACLAQVPQDAEHFGISLVEAMSAGCAAAAFNAGGPREIITHAVDGFLYGSAPELVVLTERLLADDAWRIGIGAAAMRRAAVFSPEAFARRARHVLLGD